MTSTTVLVFKFVIGLAVGSFINVIAFRYPKLNLGGRSQCRKCRKKLRWFELIPLVSFFAQKGRCRNCGRLISWQYPLVEFLTGLAFVFLPPLWLIAAVVMILLSAIDWRLMIIPDELSLFLAGLGILIAIVTPGDFLAGYGAFIPGPDNILLNRLLAVLAGGAALGVVFLLGRGQTMGLGDVKLAGALGLLAGWPAIVLSLGLGFIVGGLWSAALLITGAGKMRTLVPFGPFLVIGFWLTYFFSQPLLAWYFSLI